MKQAFKTVYVPGHPAADASQRHIRLAFGSKEQELYDVVQHMTSEEIRQFIGLEDYSDIIRFAEENALSVNRACLSLLHRALNQRHSQVAEEKAPYSAFSDPLIGTYRGGNGELFHQWYPFPEGFSSRFVDSVLDEYAPSAKRVLDPFGGTGATPLTVAHRGGVGLYCEVNLALKFVTQSKASALQLNERRRQQLTESLREHAFALPFRLSNCVPDQALKRAYLEVFQQSRFFDEETFQDVLRLRTLADELETSSPILGYLFTVAILSTLVRSSLLQRAGDLRYKTEQELKRPRASIRQLVAQKLQGMVGDLDKTESIKGPVIALATDARSLNSFPNLEVDCVITSPPYLNGTNYFRNTKLELWFLRILKRNTDLAYWRARAITAGINDVTRSKCEKIYPPRIADLVKTVAQKAYDTRIPMMVGAYFSEMREVLDALALHLQPGAMLIMDIGDSRYAGVHVKTDLYLSDMAQELGYRQASKRTLRLRKSRDGGVLEENLLVLEYQGTRRVEPMARRGLDIEALQKWEHFKASLPHQVYPHSKRNWGHPLHSLCSYQGKMKPSLAHYLIATFVPENGRVLDPFAGVGTIPFEAALQGRTAFAFDISPAAFAITQAKLNRADRVPVQKILEHLQDYIAYETLTKSELEGVKTIAFNRRLDEFYHPQTLREILLARRFFRETSREAVEWSFVLACLLHILHGNRPYALSRRSHPITPFAPTGAFEYRPFMKHLQDKVNRSLDSEYPTQFRPGIALKQDATSWWPQEVDSLDAIVTSPPFFDSTRFYLSNWIRLWFCGWEKNDFANQPLRFLELRQKESMRIYETIFNQARERLKPGGLLVLHVGKSGKCDMARELSQIARPWFQVLDVFEENVSHTESHGITDKGEVTGHQYLLLR